MPGRQGIIDRQGGINFQGIFPGISWGNYREYIMEMFHKYFTNIYLPSGEVLQKTNINPDNDINM